MNHRSSRCYNLLHFLSKTRRLTSSLQERLRLRMRGRLSQESQALALISQQLLHSCILLVWHLNKREEDGLPGLPGLIQYRYENTPGRQTAESDQSNLSLHQENEPFWNWMQAALCLASMAYCYLLLNNVCSSLCVCVCVRIILRGNKSHTMVCIKPGDEPSITFQKTQKRVRLKLPHCYY